MITNKSLKRFEGQANSFSLDEYILSSFITIVSK